MNDSQRTALRLIGSVVFVLGLLLFLIESRSTGQSLETFTLTLSPDAVSIIGAAAVGLAVVDLVFAHFWHRKRTTMKHPWPHA